jgi:hypothetical protein
MQRADVEWAERLAAAEEAAGRREERLQGDIAAANVTLHSDTAALRSTIAALQARLAQVSGEASATRLKSAPVCGRPQPRRGTGSCVCVL